MHALQRFAHKNFALGPLVSVLCYFHVFCCFLSCLPADRFLAHYSISDDSRRPIIPPPGRRLCSRSMGE
jgi:hypothetical protein